MSTSRVWRGIACVLLVGILLATRSESVGATCTTGIITGIHAGSFEAVHPSTSGNGRYTVFHTQFGLIPSDTNGQYDVYLVDRLTCALEVISVSSNETPTTNPSSFGTVSDDGNLVAFESNDTSLTVEVPGFIGPNAYLRNRSAGTTIRVSRHQPGDTGGGSRPKDSGDGSVVAFPNGGAVFVRDLAAGTTTNVTVPTGGGNPGSGVVNNIRPGVSDNGRYIAFGASHPNLVPNDTNNGPDTYRHDRLTGTTIRVSLGPAGQQSSDLSQSWEADISGDGRYVVFGSGSTTWGGACNAGNIWVRDVDLGITTLVNPSGNPSCNAIWPTISDNGRYVAFAGGAGIGAPSFVPSDTNCCLDVFVRDMTLQVTRLISTTVGGIQGNLGSPGDSAARPSISGDGQFVAYDTLANNIVPNDTNFQEDIVIVEWKYLSIAPDVNWVTNGNFSGGTNRWDTFAFPAGGDGVFNVTGGVMQFNRLPPTGAGNQAVVLQQMHAQLQAGSPITATFQLGNSSTSQRRRISALIHDSNFQDLFVCTFWLPPNTPLQTYTMRTHTNQPWFGATIAFYAASADNDPGFNRVDNVTFQYTPAQADDETRCIDPLAPPTVAGPPGGNLLQNGDFNAGTTNWSTFGLATSQVTAGVFEINRHGVDPAGGVLQNTNQPVAQGRDLTAGFDLGNSSGVRKRVTVLIHEGDFTDLSACTFWLPAGTPRATYVMRSYTTKAWVNATLSIYMATVGPEQWIEIDNVSLTETQATATNGTDCFEPGSSGASAAPEESAVATVAAPSALNAVLPGAQAPRRQTARRTPAVMEPVTLIEDDQLSVWLPPAAGEYEIQLSSDRETWRTVAVIEAAGEWRRMVIDLRDDDNGRVFVRVVVRGSD